MRPLALLLGLGLALAHQPFWNPGSPRLEAAYPIARPTVAQVVIGRLAPGEIHFFRLEVPQGFTLDMALFVSGACPEAFRPRLWLLGPGLRGEVPPFPLPEGYGARAYQGGWREYRGHGLVARKGPEARERLPGGVHYLVVEAGATGGYYLLSLAGEEVPGGSPEGFAAIPRFNRCGES